MSLDSARGTIASGALGWVGGPGFNGVTLTLASATFISVFTVRSSLGSTIDDMLKLYNFDIMLTFDRSYRSEKVEGEALRVPGITQTDIWMQLPVRRVRPDGSESGMMYMFAPHVDESALIRSPAIVDGRWLLPEDENAVLVPTTLFLDEPDLGLGREIVLKIYGKEESFKIVGTFVGVPFAPVIYANYDYISIITDRVGQADTLFARTEKHDPASVNAQSKALEEHFEDMGLRVSMLTTLTSERSCRGISGRATEQEVLQVRS